MKLKLVKESLNEYTENYSIQKEAFDFPDNQVHDFYRMIKELDYELLYTTSEDNEAYIYFNRDDYALLVTYNNQAYRAVIDKEEYDRLAKEFGTPREVYQN